MRLQTKSYVTPCTHVCKTKHIAHASEFPCTCLPLARVPTSAARHMWAGGNTKDLRWATHVWRQHVLRGFGVARVVDHTFTSIWSLVQKEMLHNLETNGAHVETRNGHKQVRHAPPRPILSQESHTPYEPFENLLGPIFQHFALCIKALKRLTHRKVN